VLEFIVGMCLVAAMVAWASLWPAGPERTWRRFLDWALFLSVIAALTAIFGSDWEPWLLLIAGMLVAVSILVVADKLRAPPQE